MPVYIDMERNRFGRMIMCHMLADSLPELHTMAFALGLKREWFQPRSTPHYDLSLTNRAKALQYGAIEIDRHAVAELIKRWRQKIMANPELFSELHVDINSRRD